jgi:hypothetical protein
VRVRVLEARDDDTAMQVEDVRVGPREREDLVVRPDGEDPLVGIRDRRRAAARGVRDPFGGARSIGREGTV